MTHFLEGVLVGFGVGFFVALKAFSRATADLAKAILEENEKCHHSSHR